MTVSEDKIKKLLEKHGFHVRSNGWPDFMCVRHNKKLNAWEFFCVEVKTGGGQPSNAQNGMIELLGIAGIKTFTVDASKMAISFGANTYNPMAAEQELTEILDAARRSDIR